MRTQAENHRDYAFAAHDKPATIADPANCTSAISDPVLNSFFAMKKRLTAANHSAKTVSRGKSKSFPLFMSWENRSWNTV
jgi:hypothetical protein